MMSKNRKRDYLSARYQPMGTRERSSHFLRENSFEIQGQQTMFVSRNENQANQQSPAHSRSELAAEKSAASMQEDQRRRRSTARQKSASNQISQQDMCILKLNYAGRNWKKFDSSSESQPMADEIIVVQTHSAGGSMIVFKGFVRPGEDFFFKSHRSLKQPFIIKIYINGFIEDRMQTCCEQILASQRFSLLKSRFCRITSITGGVPCETCAWNSLVDFNDGETNFQPIHLETHEDERIDLNSSIALGLKVNNVSLSTSTEAKKTSSNATIADPGTLNNTQDLLGKEKIMETNDDTDANDKTNTFQMDDDSRKRNKITKITNKNSETTSSISSDTIKKMEQMLNLYQTVLISRTPTYENPIAESTQQGQGNPSSTTMPQMIESIVDREEKEKQRSRQVRIQPIDEETLDESFLLLWVDETIQKNEDVHQSEIKFRQIINAFKSFKDIGPTLAYISEKNEKQIYLIVSGSLGEELLNKDEFKNNPRISSIYIFCKDKVKYEKLRDLHPKVCDIFVTADALCKKLKEDVQKELENSLPISSVPQKATPGTLDAEDGRSQFLCSQLHRKFLLGIEYENNARLQLVDLCTKIYQGNRSELKNIEELRRSYHAGKVIWWYTDETFLYKMLNRALMSRKPQLLHCFQFLIKDLHTRLEQLHRQYLSTAKSSTLKLYRGVCLTQKVLDETIRNCKGGLIGFDSFLSTSLKKEVAERFANLGKTKENQLVIFQIEINVEHMKQPFAEISRYSAVPKEQEVLFSFGTVFRIQDVIEPDDRTAYYTVNLTSIEETNSLLTNETHKMNQMLSKFFITICEKNENNPQQGKLAASFANLARVYYNQKDYDNSLKYYQKARSKLNEVQDYDPLTMANYISNIAMIHADRAESEKKEDHDSEKKKNEWREEALNLYKEALDIRCKNCERDDPSLIDTLRTMGELYENMKNFSDALECYRNAFNRLNSIKKPESRDYSSIGVTLIMMGQLFNQEGNYNEALKQFKLALENYEEDAFQFLVKRSEIEGSSSRSPSAISTDEKLSVLERNPAVALLYNNIGAMHHKLGSYQESLDQQLKCLKVEKENLPEQHETFVETYENIAENYEAMLKYDLAIEFCEKAIRQSDFIKNQEKQLRKQDELNKKLEQLKNDKQKV